jgi:Family of unknown function (DUF6010)
VSDLTSASSLQFPSSIHQQWKTKGAKTMDHVVPEVTFIHVILSLVLVPIFITLMSLFKEPTRQKVNAVIIAAAGAAYANHGLGLWEQVFSVLMIYMAFKGLTNYKYIAVAWIFHTAFDIPHHLYAVPIDPTAPFSSFVCMIFDPLIAIWFYFGAPTVFDWFKRPRTSMPVGS